MRNYQLKKSILTEPWAISPEVAVGFSFLIESLFNPNLAMEPISDSRAASVVSRTPVSQTSKQRDFVLVGMVNIVGALTKYDPECDYGMESYGRMIQELDSDNQVLAIVLKIDSPGGSVAGTEELGRIIKSTTKPTIAYISGQACSAAYWLASCADEIIADSDLARVGSIGVLATYVDLTKHYEQQGIEVRSVYASQSADKNQDYIQLFKGNSALVQESLDAFADNFISVVKSNRAGVLDEQLTGKVYFARDVIGSLVDSIGTIDAAIIRACELANLSASDEVLEEVIENASENPAFTEINHNNNLMTQRTNLNRVLGVSELAAMDGAVSLNEEQLDMLEAALAPQEEEQSMSVEEQLAQALIRVETLETENASLNDRLANQPAEQPATVASKVDVSQKSTTPINTMMEARASIDEYQEVLL